MTVVSESQAKAFDLSEDQGQAIGAILAWLDQPRQRLTVGGLAGTGKTTIVSHLLRILNATVAVCAYTGKAANVLRRKGIHDACTMHKLLYVCLPVCPCCERMNCKCAHHVICVGCRQKRPCLCSATASFDEVCACCGKTRPCSCMNEKTRFVKVPELDYDLIIVDEASMISARLLDDLESYGKKVLLVGDHGQLEPIGSNPKVMLHPDVRLEQIHRQAAGSSIIKFAHVLREGRNPAQWVGVDRESVHIRPGFPDDPAAFDVVICGFNKTRVRLNRQIREDRGFSGSRPVEGEWVICLRNNHDMGVFNGQRFRVVGVKETAGLHTLSLVDEDDAKFKDIPYAPEQFGRESTDLTINRSKCLFDWGYALTAHKSQGSEWDRVAVIEEIGQSWSAARWRYTASTRAAKELHYYV